jgi:hypothetical protein
MRWKIETEKKTYTVSAVSSRIAVEKITKKDITKIKSVKLLPKNTTDKIKSIWRSWFGK